MNKPMAVWGLLLFAGFLVSHYLVFSYDPSFTLPLWIILAALGFGYCRLACKCKKKCKCCCCSDLWSVGIAEALILTVAIAIQLLPISPFYLLSVWLLCLGSAMLAESFRDKKALKAQLGALWLFSAVFFPFANNFQSASFMTGALVLGVGLMLAGLVMKE